MNCKASWFRRAVLLAICAATAPAFAQKDLVKWSLTLDPAVAAPGVTVLAKLEARVDPGWHMYSFTPVKGANIPTTLKVDSAVVADHKVLQPPPKRALDPSFNKELETYEGTVVFLVQLQIKKDAPAGPAEIALRPRYQVCDATHCIPPVTKNVTATLTVDAASASAADPAIPAGYAEPAAALVETAGSPSAGTGTSEGLGAFLAVAFGFGLLTIFTPCVFPMIPITMSFFLNRQAGSRSESITQALIFCLGIVVLFSGLGLAATAILGPFGVVQLGSNPWVNGFISLVFLLFGLSLLGAFEITIPSGILTRLDRASQKGGVAGTLLMGLTFSLTSFACVGPFVGSLLAASVQGGGARPLLGMVCFSSGLALPFFFLALFPSYLKRLPKSGGWLARVKVVMGFVILAAMLKYLSSLDQVLQWKLLTRERFLAAWIVLFAMAGLYLLGFVRLEGIKPDEHMGLGRLLTGIAFLIFAISLVPGMFGGRLGELDGYVPVATNTAAFGGGGAESKLVWLKNQYREALAKARAEGKLLFVNFTGYACTNCHWMKANMFPRPEIASALSNFVLVELYTDGSDEASQLNQQLQESKFKTIAIPFYAILDPDENVIATFGQQTRDAKEFLAFLEKGSQPRPPAAQTVAAAGTAAGPLAGVPLTTLDGGAFDAAALSGKVVVVNFWATWCIPCIQEIPSFNRIHKELGGKGVAVLGVSMDEDDAAAKVKSFLTKHPMEYAVALGSEKASEKFQLSNYPVTVVFDREGKLLKRFEGFTPEQSLADAVKTAL
jgi:thiol:disulfide interchange protein DsbD